MSASAASGATGASDLSRLKELHASKKQRPSTRTPEPPCMTPPEHPLGDAVSDALSRAQVLAAPSADAEASSSSASKPIDAHIKALRSLETAGSPYHRLAAEVQERLLEHIDRLKITDAATPAFTETEKALYKATGQPLPGKTEGQLYQLELATPEGTPVLCLLFENQKQLTAYKAMLETAQAMAKDAKGDAAKRTEFLSPPLIWIKEQLLDAALESDTLRCGSQISKECHALETERASRALKQAEHKTDLESARAELEGQHRNYLTDTRYYQTKCGELEGLQMEIHIGKRRIDRLRVNLESDPTLKTEMSAYCQALEEKQAALQLQHDTVIEAREHVHHVQTEQRERVENTKTEVLRHETNVREARGQLAELTQALNDQMARYNEGLEVIERVREDHLAVGSKRIQTCFSREMKNLLRELSTKDSPMSAEDIHKTVLLHQQKMVAAIRGLAGTEFSPYFGKYNTILAENREKMTAALAAAERLLGQLDTAAKRRLNEETEYQKALSAFRDSKRTAKSEIKKATEEFHAKKEQFEINCDREKKSFETKKQALETRRHAVSVSEETEQRIAQEIAVVNSGIKRYNTKLASLQHLEKSLSSSSMTMAATYDVLVEATQRHNAETDAFNPKIRTLFQKNAELSPSLNRPTHARLSADLMVFELVRQHADEHHEAEILSIEDARATGAASGSDPYLARAVKIRNQVPIPPIPAPLPEISLEGPPPKFEPTKKTPEKPLSKDEPLQLPDLTVLPKPPIEDPDPVVLASVTPLLPEEQIEFAIPKSLEVLQPPLTVDVPLLDTFAMREAAEARFDDPEKQTFLTARISEFSGDSVRTSPLSRAKGEKDIRRLGLSKTDTAWELVETRDPDGKLLVRGLRYHYASQAGVKPLITAVKKFVAENQTRTAKVSSGSENMTTKISDEVQQAQRALTSLAAELRTLEGL